jgi:hypothetical protein
MRERNILGSSKGYIDRIVASYSSVTLENARKYFLSTLKFCRLYMDGENAFTVNKKIQEMRKKKKCNRGAVELIIDQSKKAYNRDRF